MGNGIYNQSSRAYRCIYDADIINYIIDQERRRKEKEQEDQKRERIELPVGNIVHIDDVVDEAEEPEEDDRGVAIIDFDINNPAPAKKPNKGVVSGIVLNMMYR
ncbi:hypothetical protein KY363_07525 [Candidatus Woesearchaeota archaeon]|nr:hypothetical protein [Candidatus Woesearchaeota archaeon]